MYSDIYLQLPKPSLNIIIVTFQLSLRGGLHQMLTMIFIELDTKHDQRLYKSQEKFILWRSKQHTIKYFYL